MTRKEYKEYLRRFPKKCVQPSFDFIRRVEKESHWMISSQIGEIDGVSIRVKKIHGENKFSFVTSNYRFTSEGRKFDLFGFDKNLLLRAKDRKWYLIAGASTVTQHSRKTTFTSGEFEQFQFRFSDGLCFHRAIMPCAVHLQRYFDVFGVRIFGNFINDCCVRFIVCGHEYHFFSWDGYIILDSLSPIDTKTFESIVTSLIYTLGFVTGSTPCNERYILQSDQITFEKVSGCWFKTIERGNKTHRSVIQIERPRFQQPVNAVRLVSSQVIGNFISKAIDESRFLRVLKIITRANSYPIEIQGAAYSVALETMKNIVSETANPIFRTFKSDSVARSTINKLQDIVREIDDSEFNDKRSVLDKMTQINQIGNRKALIAIFMHYGISLTPTDENVIHHRNTFLHGYAPDDENRGTGILKNSDYVTLKLHFLLSALILKYCGFTGSIKNTVRHHRQIKGLIDEPDYLDI